jgi:hypothetical protein
MISPATLSKVRSMVPPDRASNRDEYTMALTSRDSVYIGLEHGEQEAETLRRQALESLNIVGLFCPYSRSLLTPVWSTQASD